MRVHVRQQMLQVVQEVLRQIVTQPLFLNHGGAERNAAHTDNKRVTSLYTKHPSSFYDWQLHQTGLCVS